MIIPFFITHSGCPHQCVFCNQRHITGQTQPAVPADIPLKIEEYLASLRTGGPVSVAFYGGNFTGLPLAEQTAFLEAVQPFIRYGRIHDIRLSTRPDNINRTILALLGSHHVKIVELGAQSLNDRVLKRAGRGHTAADTINAVGLLREQGFSLGLQLMPGLPGDSAECFMETVNRAIALRLDLVRLYPAVVIAHTPLEHLFRSGEYVPLSLTAAVDLCREALLRFERAGIEVVRIGLQSTAELEKPGTIIAGPYHPAFRELVESSIMLDRMRSALQDRKDNGDVVTMHVNSKDLSAAIGQRRSNIEMLKKEFGLRDLRIMRGTTMLARRSPAIP